MAFIDIREAPIHSGTLAWALARGLSGRVWAAYNTCPVGDMQIRAFVNSLILNSVPLLPTY